MGQQEWQGGATQLQELLLALSACLPHLPTTIALGLLLLPPLELGVLALQQESTWQPQALVSVLEGEPP